jgi:hypothetical protein
MMDSTSPLLCGVCRDLATKKREREKRESRMMKQRHTYTHTHTNIPARGGAQGIEVYQLDIAGCHHMIISSTNPSDMYTIILQAQLQNNNNGV